MARKWPGLKFRDAEDGAALLEAAVVVPFLITLMIGLMDFGLAYRDLTTAQKSIRAAARYLSRLPISRLCTTGAGSGQEEAQYLAVYGKTKPDLTADKPLIANWDKTNVTITLDPVCPSTSSTTPVDRTIKLAANVQYNALGWTYFGFAKTINMTANHSERWIGQ